MACDLWPVTCDLWPVTFELWLVACDLWAVEGTVSLSAAAAAALSAAARSAAALSGAALAATAGGLRLVARCLWHMACGWWRVAGVLWLLCGLWAWGLEVVDIICCSGARGDEMDVRTFRCHQKSATT